MSNILHFLKPEIFITSLGNWALLGITLVIFAESGLFFGFFLPGDSLLFTAGLLSSQGYLPILPLLFLSLAAAVVGDNIGYWFGKKVGPKIFSRDESFLFKKHHLEAAKKFYETHGSKTIVLARFVPFVRTFAPIVAGAAEMSYSVFMMYNLLGGALWAVGITLLGFFLGQNEFVRHHNEAIILLIVAASIVPVVIHVLQDYLKHHRSKS
jgi:membrane-associated protein